MDLTLFINNEHPADDDLTARFNDHIEQVRIARQLLRKYPGAQVPVLEKEPSPGRHQTGNNSGVLQCGLYYTPGSLKARLAVEGIREMVEFCEEHNVPHEVCGKLVVATNDTEVDRKGLPPTSSQPPLPLDARMCEGQHVGLAVVEETF